MRALRGRTAVITGGAGGLGLAMARRFLEAGMRVMIGDIEESAIDEAIDGLGGRSTALDGAWCDVTRPDSVEALRSRVMEQFGEVDVACLNAGVVATGPMLQSPLSTWRWLFEVNVFGVVNGVHAFVPAMVDRGDGHVVITASAAAMLTAPQQSAYSATKHAVLGLGAVLRDEVAPSGVGVSLLCPGVLRTRLFYSERNRPADLDGTTHVDESAAGYRHMAATALDPSLVADAAHDAVTSNQFLVFPSPERAATGLIVKRLREIQAALPPKIQ